LKSAHTSEIGKRSGHVKWLEHHEVKIHSLGANEISNAQVATSHSKKRKWNITPRIILVTT